MEAEGHMKLVYWLFILVLVFNLMVGDGRVAAILSFNRSYMEAFKFAMIALGAVLLTMILMRVLFADFASHTLPPPSEPKPPQEEAPAPQV
jgi:hypothetical protein